MKKSEVVDRVVELLSDKSGEMRNLIRSWVDIVLADIASRGLLDSLKFEETAGMFTAHRGSYGMAVNTDQYFGFFIPSLGYPQGVLQKLNDNDFMRRRLEDGIDTEGPPQFYNIFGNSSGADGNSIRVHPIPDKTYSTISWRYKDVTALNESDDIREIKLKHIPTLIYGAYSMGAKFDSILDAADSTMKYEKGVGRIMMDNNTDICRPQQVIYRDLG